LLLRNTTTNNGNVSIFIPDVGILASYVLKLIAYQSNLLKKKVKYIQTRHDIIIINASYFASGRFEPAERS